jgi:hypothetical protein
MAQYPSGRSRSIRTLHRRGNIDNISISPLVTVHPPDHEGGRAVRIHGTEVGHAYGLWDMIVRLHRAGLEQGLADEDEITPSDQIKWIGGGPNDWEP